MVANEVAITADDKKGMAKFTALPLRPACFPHNSALRENVTDLVKGESGAERMCCVCVCVYVYVRVG